MGAEDGDRGVLLKRAQQGDSDAFESLVERHQDSLFGLAARILRSKAEAADVLQETLLAAYEHLQAFGSERDFGSWARRHAAKSALTRLRCRQELCAPKFTKQGALAKGPVADWSGHADATLLNEELARAVRSAIDQLPDGYREIFLLKDVEGMSYEEISKVTGTSVATVKARLHRARLAIREDIDAFFGR